MNLAKLAAFLGPTYAVHDDPDDEGTPYIIWEVAPSYWHGRFKSDAELFYALLVRAADVDPSSTPVLWKNGPLWYCKMWPKGRDVYYEYTIVEEGLTPLDALVKAIEEMP